MSTKTTILASIIVIIIALIAGFLFWGQLPEQMASHWNINDQVDGTTSKFWGVFLMPLISLAMLGLFIVLPSIDPLKENIAEFRPAFNTFILLIIVFMLYIYGLTLAWNLGWMTGGMGAMVVPAIGLLFIAVSRMIRVAKRNYFIGIRTPWTLANDEVWNKTHALGSKLFAGAGIITMLGAILPGAAFYLLLVSALGATLITTVYSFVIFRQMQPK